MKCPRCNEKLTAGSYEKKEAMHCRKCSGIMIKQRDLTAVLTRLSQDLFSNHHLDTKLNHEHAAHPVGRCPACKSQMEHYPYMFNKDIMIDFCEKCNWLWIDPGELFLMAKRFLQSEKEYEYIRKTAHQGIDMVGVVALERAFLSGFCAGVLGDDLLL